MIVIDGRESRLSLSNYANLGEVLTTLVKEESLDERIVTDVFVNEEAFSELYPHQADDISATEVKHLEVRTVSTKEMAADIIDELPKIVNLLASGGREVAGLFREHELADGLEVLQDLIVVSRDFLSTVQVLRDIYASGASKQLEELADVLGNLLGEITEVMVNEDWFLVADLFEYEYIPACEGWRAIIEALRAQAAA